MDLDHLDLAQNLAAIAETIEAACMSSGRSRDEVTLIAVTKTVPIPRIQAAYALGLRHLGESRWQEAQPKLDAMPSDCVWHFIGPLQSNKARRVAERFQAIHSVDSESQLREIAKANREVDLLVEVNVGEEKQKSGVDPVNLAGFVERVLQYEHVRFRGLMAIGPNLGDPEGMRPIFRQMRKWNESFGGQWLSMGMSGDFDVAIQEGATHIRIGSALFGARAKN